MLRKTKNNNFFYYFFNSTKLAAVVLGLSLANGLVFSLAWNWIAVPIFSLPRLNIIQALAVMILLTIMLDNFRKTEDRAKNINEFIVTRVTFLVIAYFIKLFI